MRARKLKKHPVEERETRALREPKKQKVVGVLEEARKPVIIQAPKAIPSRVTRTELRKLEEQILKNVTDKEPNSVAISFETGKIFIKQKSGGVKVIPIMKADMGKIEELIKKAYREISK
jgi:hypothetical protein